MSSAENPNTVPVSLGARSYDIVIGQKLLATLGPRCAALGLGSSCLVVTDDNVAALYLEQAKESLAAAGFKVATETLPAGEPTKCVARLSQLWERAVTSGLDRKSFVVALGGGVIGDLSGFLAASYLRGVDFVQVPTSLLAMVDSAVGGKTGMNLPQGKNLVGAFHQPRLVLADIDLLHTLPPREFAAGMAEVIKYGVIRDAELFATLEARVERIQALDPSSLAHLVGRSCEIKAEVVAEDEREGGLRAILNYGHTLGHAIENSCGYGTYLHGEAISIGMVYAARLSERVAAMPAADCARQQALFQAFDLPVTAGDLSWEALWPAMCVDKKALDALPRFVLAKGIGQALLPREVSSELLKEVWDDGCCK